MKMLSTKQSDALIPASIFFRTLGEHAKRSPSTIRKIIPPTIEPEGFILWHGIAVQYYSEKSLAFAIDHFTNHPPKGSGRPKGSKNRGKK